MNIHYRNMTCSLCKKSTTEVYPCGETCCKNFSCRDCTKEYSIMFNKEYCCVECYNKKLHCNNCNFFNIYGTERPVFCNRCSNYKFYCDNCVISCSCNREERYTSSCYDCAPKCSSCNDIISCDECNDYKFNDKLHDKVCNNCIVLLFNESREIVVKNELNKFFYNDLTNLIYSYIKG